MRKQLLVLGLFLTVGCNSATPINTTHVPGTKSDTPVPTTPDAATADAAPIVSTPDAGTRADGPTCTTLQPNILFVLDKSGSMTTHVDHDLSKWDIAKGAVEALLTGPQIARFGLSLFAHGKSEDTCAPGSIDVAPADDSATAILDVLEPLTDHALSNGGNSGVGTPIAGTLHALRDTFTDKSRANAIILFTDGGDNCASGNARVAVRNQIDALVSANPSVRVYVVTAQKDASKIKSELNDWAEAGQTARVGELKYYLGANIADMKAIFQQIATDATRCATSE